MNYMDFMSQFAMAHPFAMALAYAVATAVVNTLLHYKSPSSQAGQTAAELLKALGVDPMRVLAALQPKSSDPTPPANPQ